MGAPSCTIEDRAKATERTNRGLGAPSFRPVRWGRKTEPQKRTAGHSLSNHHRTTTGTATAVTRYFASELHDFHRPPRSAIEGGYSLRARRRSTNSTARSMRACSSVVVAVEDLVSEGGTEEETEEGAEAGEVPSGTSQERARRSRP